ncbi:hypothetical protein [Paeniglutamicibacter psychrophenolicus]|uniref:hypothetical protein n=1 Tax=Paeniglutamicibacter psychrophenolicus TaxID=257454 RepID=UPI00278253F7|nr:hypothetical protein [Paeniglutamicibacter psychrophenolicus]MDQ0092519.1 hypothetical protein [Paeniglutamicibacter psychrophenolicus]
MNIPRPRIAFLPNTPDARLLADLTSHASDLSEASHTLGEAFAAGEGSGLWLPLTSHAVTAYVRPFIHSNVRTRLDEMPGIPAMSSALKTVHDTIRKYRNTTIAHSQSDLAVPLPVAILDAEGLAVEVKGISIIHQMPLILAERFSCLVSSMEDVVDQATQPVLERLWAWLKDETADTIRDWAKPEFAHATDEDFTAAQKRTRTPSFTAYWHVEQSPDGEQPHEPPSD